MSNTNLKDGLMLCTDISLQLHDAVQMLGMPEIDKLVLFEKLADFTQELSRLVHTTVKQ